MNMPELTELADRLASAEGTEFSALVMKVIALDEVSKEILICLLAGAARANRR